LSYVFWILLVIIKDLFFYILFKLIILIAVTCGQNEIFDTRAECPRTCLDPQGIKFCGVRTPRESCYCRDGYVRNSAGRCVKLEECGCRRPDGSGLVGVGKSVVSRDCSRRFTCAGPQQAVRVENLRRCSPHGQCRGNQDNVPTCYCKAGFEGDGYNCKPIVKSTPAPVNPCKQANVCGRGAVCQNRNGKAQCLCRGRPVGNKQTCCNRELRC
jgi:hypothetical protein